MPTLAYPVTLETDSAGRVLVLFPDFPEAATDGADRAEALAEAPDCLQEAIAGRLARREPVPPPSPARGRPTVVPGAIIAAKAALHTALRDAALTNTALADRLGVAEGEVRRLLDPRHASKIARLEAALGALGQRLEIAVRPAA